MIDMSKSLDIPERTGKAPKVAGYVPHQQIDQHSNKEVFEALKMRAAELPHVSLIKSRTTVDESIGLSIDPGVKLHPKAEREFTHLNVEPGPGSFHVKLPTEILDYIVSRGWGIYHPMSEVLRGRPGQIAVALVYAPRDMEELEVAMAILNYAHEFSISTPNKRSIFSLVGFMGCGKTSIGKRISKDLKIPFVDLDAYIEEAEGLTINEIFTLHGESTFRLLETHYLNALVDKNDKLILATGGGTPCYDQNWAALDQTYTIYIERTDKYLFKNLQKKKKKRPLIKNLSDEALKRLITEKMKIRAAAYRKSDINYFAEGSKQDIAKGLSKKIKKKLKKLKR
jgi:shikimate kinase